VDEVPLGGGSVSTVVRVGDTVRRAQSRWSAAVADLLRHLEAAGFDGAPRYLGVDDQGREVLTWIEGTPATMPWPAELLNLRGVRDLGLLLRRFHDAVASYQPPAKAEWWIGERRVQPGEIVIHGDLGPWNTIWRDGQPVAFIDWDFAEPAQPVADLAEMAFFVIPMRDDKHSVACGFGGPVDRRTRLWTLCDAYGFDDVSAVVDQVESYWELEIARTTEFGPKGIHPWAGFLARGLPQGERQLLDWVRRHRGEFA
jgi:Phosphotransferase enzyme family